MHMGNSMDSYPAVCWWCGTIETDNWVEREGRIYCSVGCHLAATYKENIGMGFCFLSIAFLMGAIHPVGGFFGLFSLISFRVAYEGRKYLHKKDKYGAPPREKLRTLDFSQRLPSPRPRLNLICSHCGHLNRVDILRCENCGASLLASDLAKLTVVPSSNSKRVKCPWCSAVYSYSPSSFREEGSVVCQNCNKSFFIEQNDEDD